MAASGTPLVGDALVQAGRTLVSVEQEVLRPFLDDRLSIAERRRMGKRFRMRRDAQLHRACGLSRRSRSQSELYEMARRAGVANRSRMTLSQLQAAIESWEEAARHS